MKKWCDCGRLIPNARIENNILICNDCNKPIKCEFSFLDDSEHAAQLIHVDYAVCKRHEQAAIDNVSSR